MPNFKSLCALQVLLLQGVSKLSSKESKRTSVVPDWCQIGSLTAGMFHIYIGDAICRISSLYVHYKWYFSKVGVSKSSSKESKRTSMVPDWCQIGSLTSRMF